MENIGIRQLSLLYETAFGNAPETVIPLKISGSHRKYYRLGAGSRTVVGVIGTDVKENLAFCYFARHFASKGICVPEVYAVSEDSSCYLQEDLGDLSLFDCLADARKSRRYSDAQVELLKKTVASLPAIQFKGAEGLDFEECYPVKSLDSMSVMFDLNYFKYCFLKQMPVEFNEVLLENDFRTFAGDILERSDNCFMYRDFQSRNVMVKDGKPYFIDFQGGIRGASYYDLASFVWQARSAFPKYLKDELVAVYIESMREYRTPDMIPDAGEFNDNLHKFVLFRTLQVLGAYGFRGLTEKKQHFIESIPFAISNLGELMEKPIDNCPYLSSVLRELSGLPEFAQKQTESSSAVSDEVAASASAPLSASASASSESSVAASSAVVSASSASEIIGGSSRLEVEVFSFSYKNGIPMDYSGNGGGYVFDCRAIHNPGKYDEYKSLTGRDAPVIEFLEADGEVLIFLGHIYPIADAHISRYLKRGFTHLMFSFGCTGGRHRSVYCAESLARYIARKYAGKVSVKLVHKEQKITAML